MELIDDPVEPVEPPSGLGSAGADLWRRIDAQAVEDGIVLLATEREWLRLACQEADLLAVIEQHLAAALGDGELTTKGSMGQKVIHPLVAEVGKVRTRIANLLARLSFPDPEGEAKAVGHKWSGSTAREAALKRHYGKGRGIA